MNKSDVKASHFRTDCPAKQCFIVSDPKLVEQVLLNFASNASKFTSQGHITIGYRLVSSGGIRFYVEDTGKGVPEEMRQKIFDRFVKVDSFSQGTGLGLEISREAVNRLGGKIGIDSTLGKGSTFWFELPNKE